MELRQLRYAVAVADHLNFREASRALHVAQPPLSVQIKQLEEEIGVALFIRSKRHVEITRPGKVFLKTAREALAMSRCRVWSHSLRAWAWHFGQQRERQEL